jgi:hypothetical protein
VEVEGSPAFSLSKKLEEHEMCSQVLEPSSFWDYSDSDSD